MRQLVTETAARATEAELGRTFLHCVSPRYSRGTGGSWGELGQLLGNRLRKTGQSTRNKDVRSAHNETASTHNKSVARATETVVRTASTCGCMLHSVVEGCCSPGCTAACGGGCGVAPALVAPAAVVGGAAGGGYPQPTGCMGKRVTLKYPCSGSNTKRKMQ